MKTPNLTQRLYQALTSSTPPPGPPYISTTNFASLRAGPGNTKPLHAADGEGITGVTSFRISTKDRSFVDEVHYKGWTVKLADWLHLSNADDPNRPIVAQVFRCWISEDLCLRSSHLDTCHVC
jgi:chromatin structure-remodeling complex subunit RSC1/2